MSRFGGHLFIVAGPSGSGKSSLIKRFLSENKNFDFPTSVTTREPRQGEVEGQHYIFWDEATFKKGIQEEAFLEYAKVYGKYYGTLKATIQQALSGGKKLLKDVDIQGAEALMEMMPKDQLTTVFIMPPSLGELKRRLRERRSESEETLKRRLAEAEMELQGMDLFDKVIVNDVFDEAYVDFRDVLLFKD